MPGLVLEGNFRIDNGYDPTFHLLGNSDRPTALFVSNGLMAIGALKAIAALGLRCPEEIALATFDDSPLNEILTPPLTSVAQPAFQIGYRGARILLDRIRSKGPAKPCRIRLRAELEIRHPQLATPSLAWAAASPPQPFPDAPRVGCATISPGMLPAPALSADRSLRLRT